MFQLGLLLTVLHVGACVQSADVIQNFGNFTNRRRHPCLLVLFTLR